MVAQASLTYDVFLTYFIVLSFIETDRGCITGGGSEHVAQPNQRSDTDASILEGDNKGRGATGWSFRGFQPIHYEQQGCA